MPALTVPTSQDALCRLRLDEDLAADVTAAIAQAHTQAEAFLDGKLYADAQGREDAGDVRGIICTPDIIAAQLLLVDVLVGNNDTKAQQAKRDAAYAMLRYHRNVGV